MNDEIAMRLADQLSLVATQLQEITKVLASMNEKLGRIELQTDSRAPGH